MTRKSHYRANRESSILSLENYRGNAAKYIQYKTDRVPLGKIFKITDGTTKKRSK